MKIKYCLLFVFLIPFCFAKSTLFISVCSLLNSLVIEVIQDGSGDYTTIQAGIDASADNDTIHVFSGTFYENIFIDKSISLVSTYEYSNNDEDIHSTILDGNQQSSVIRLEGESTEMIDVYICGFVIQNGSGFIAFTLPHPRGGGILSENVSLILKKNVIKNNKAYIGGGLDLRNTQTYMTGNTIKENKAELLGGGVVLYDTSNIIFSETLLNNIYLNYAGRAADIHKYYDCPVLEIIVDTFTISEPDFYFISSNDPFGFYLEDEITYNIQNAKIEQVEHDLFVSAFGDDNNSGLTPEEPLQNIHYALTKIKADSLNPRTIHIADGIYSPSLNNQYFPLHMKSYVSILGESRENTIFDSENGLITIYARDIIEEGFLQRNNSVKNLKIMNNYWDYPINIERNENVYLENLEFTNCITSSRSMIRSNETNTNFENLYFHDNYGGRAIIISCTNGQPTNIVNCIIENNYPSEDTETPLGTGLLIYNNPPSQLDFEVNIINTQINNNVHYGLDWPNSESAIRILDWADVNIINSTIGNNESYTGGAVVIHSNSELNIYNSILYGNDPREICVYGSYSSPNTVNIYNSLVQGGEAGIQSFGENFIYYDDSTNIDADPLWQNEGDYPFALSELSPCIDAGTLDLPEGIELPEYDLAGYPRIYGETIDMGAYEFQDTVSVLEEIVKPIIQTKISNYPNPFNSETTISFKISREDAEHVEVIIYNVKGQKVKTLMDAQISPGVFNLIWYGRDENHLKLSSGTYFVKLNVNGDEISTEKMILLK